jgi:hypothetical protein
MTMELNLYITHLNITILVKMDLTLELHSYGTQLWKRIFKLFI